MILRILRSRLRGEGGYTLVAVMGIMAAVSALSVAAFAATGSDFRPGAADKERKQAYAAAEAGVNDYLSRLIANPDYWRVCASDAANASLNQVNPATRRWASVAAAPTTSEFSVELLPANDKPSCDATDPVATFIDATTGTFRIRSTGRARSTGGPRRSIIATFRRRGFLDYIYYTDYETVDPQWYRRDSGDRLTRENRGSPTAPPGRSVVQWGVSDCTKYWRDGRGSATFNGSEGATTGSGVLKVGGTATNNADWQAFSIAKCGEIRFVGNATDQDRVNGPLHTNDDLLLCGTPHFGRYPTDDIETSGAVNGVGWRQDGGCTGTPEVNTPTQTAGDRGTLRPNSPLVSLPPSNSALRDDALPAYRFRGKTTIVLNGANMTVTGKRDNGTALPGVSMPIPADGVIYVANDTVGSCSGYNPINAYAPAPACGDAWVRGTYDKNVTINAENDIVIDEDVLAGGSAKPLLGLISNNWIRVYHPVSDPTSPTCTTTGGPGPVTIDAAILSLNHSFAVDNYWCGSKIGDLTVNGAIGQKYRGLVGSGGAVSGSGYLKKYNYNNDLRFRSPPRFLDPVQSTWKLKSQVEQVPAA